MSNTEQETPTPERPRVTVWTLVFLASVLGLFFVMQNVETKGVYDVSYTQFKKLVEAREVVEVRLRGERAEGRLHGPLPIGPEGQEGERFRTRIPLFGDESLLPLLEARGVVVRVEKPEPETNWGLLSLMIVEK